MKESESTNLFNPMDEEYETTGKTIEEVRNGKTTIGQLRDEIIESAVAVVANNPEVAEIQGSLADAVDAYHAALRQQAREGK